MGLRECSVLRIEKSQLKPGMYVEAIEGADASSNLPRARFLLKTVSDVEQLRQCSATHFIINPSRGIAPTQTRSKSSSKVREAQKTIGESVTVLRHAFDGILDGGAIDIDQIQPVVSIVSRSLDDNPAVFLNVSRLKSKDEVTYQHSISVSALMVLFSRHLGFDDAKVEEIGVAGLLHDLGKLEIDDGVLNKAGTLDDQEKELIRSHPQRGYDILKRQKGVTDLMLDVCLHHHERMDGAGYPIGLRKERISVYARLAAICDVYDAVTTVRPYKTPWTPAQALKWMLNTRGHFDMKMLRKFVICISTALE